MKRHSYGLQKVSSQRLVRFIAVALCMISIGFPDFEAQADKQSKKRPKQCRTKSASRGKKTGQKIEHIPPPIIIEDGSLELEFNRDLQHDQLSGPRPHIYRPRNTPRLIEGVRVMTQSGETLFPNPPSLCEGCEIQIWLKKPIDPNTPQIIVKEAQGSFHLEIDKELTPNPNTPSGDCVDTSYKPKRCKKFRHMGDAGIGYDPVIERVRILTRNGREVFKRDINAPDHFHGCRVLIWWH